MRVLRGYEAARSSVEEMSKKGAPERKTTRASVPCMSGGRVMPAAEEAVRPESVWRVRPAAGEAVTTLSGEETAGCEADERRG